MLKVLSYSCRFQNVLSSHSIPSAVTRNCTDSTTPLLRVLNSLRGFNRCNPNLYHRAFFCSDSSSKDDESAADGGAAAKSATGEREDAESKSSNVILPSVFRPDECFTVLALPLPHRPLFPGFYMPVYVKDPKLLAALVESQRRQAPYAGAFLVKDEPDSDTEKNINDLKGQELLNRLHEVGTLAQITSIQGEQVVLIGHRRLRITEMVKEDPLTVKVDHLKDLPYDKDNDVIKATSFEVISTVRDVLQRSSLWRDHVQTYTKHVGDFNYPRLADFGAAISGGNKFQCQQVLEELDVLKRLQLTLELVKKEMEISKIQETIAKAIEEKISGEHRRYLLNEQLKAIKKELGLETDDKTALSSKFRERIEPKKDKIPQHVLQIIEEELTKLQLLEASSSEFNVTRNYLDWLTALPWGDYSDENFDVIRAQTILDEDHYGLSDVKERILEFIAVGKLRGTAQGKIVCLSGPPGVGKTSIGRSVARALNRKFYRFSVGGLSDVAEIKGHRRTYIGAMPGKMVQCLKSVGTANPLVLIDEIDKLGRGHAGDPASAMLELLDPEQNANFLDHYLDVPIDLSKVLFICTANVIEQIPNPLLDRMEAISIAGYITDEKMHIARDYLEKTTRETCGIKPAQVELTDAALLSLIESYCREAGVRNLQKHIEKIYRKIALHLVRQDATDGSSSVVSDEPKADCFVDSSGTMIQEENKIKSETNEKTLEKDPDETNSDDVILEPKSAEKSNDKPSDSKEITEADEAEEPKVIEKVVVDKSNLADYVGKPVFHAERIYDKTPAGVVDKTPEVSNSISEISKLIAKQHWRKLKDILNHINPNDILRQLFDTNSDPRLIILYFKWLERDYGISHDIEVYFKVFHMLASGKLYGEIRKLLIGFVKNGKYSNSEFFHTVSTFSDSFGVNIMLVDMLVQTYVKNSEVGLAVEAVRRAWQYGFRLSLLSFNPLLSALVDEGKIKIMEQVFKEMIRRKVQPDLITFNTVINGFCKVGELQRASDLLEDIKLWGLSPSVVTYNTLIAGYCKSARAGKIFKADAFLKEMVSLNVSPDVITFNILIDGFCKDQDLTAAMKVYEEMKNQGLKPSVITYNSLIRGFCIEGKIDEALEFRNAMCILGLKPNIMTYNVLINGYAKKGMVKEAKELLEDADKNGLTPSVVTFNTLIGAYGNAGMMDEAVALKNLMLERNIPSDVSTYNCLIGGFYKQDDFEAAGKIFIKMKDAGIEADVVTYNIRIGAFCRKGKTRKAVKLLDEMFEMGLTPTHVTYNTLIDGYCSKGNVSDAMKLRKRMEKDGRRANVVTYNVLLKGLCNKAKMQDANMLLNEMLEKGLSPNRITYDIIKEGMMEKGFVPDIDGHFYNQSSNP